jgi:hypothetical protein
MGHVEIKGTGNASIGCTSKAPHHWSAMWYFLRNIEVKIARVRNFG